ncbi:MAG: Fic family protein [Candidatus Omnitrophota bacterium]
MEKYIYQLTQILEKSGWSQVRLAEEVGVSFATVNRWLNGHTRPHLAQIRQIEKLFREFVGIIPLPEKDIEFVLEKVTDKKKQFCDIKKFLQNERIVEEFMLEVTYNSDAIEGNTLTKKETEAVIFDKAALKNKSLIEHLEAVNHASVLKDIFAGKLQEEIDENIIKKMHKMLMQGIREDAGEYAKYQRGIRGVDLILPHPEDIPEEMRLFCDKVNNYAGHPLEHIAKMHADFEAIHPFGDGNGRIGRLIMIIQCLKNNLAPCVINVEEKAKYYETLEYAQKRSETHFVCFAAEAVLKGYKIIEKYVNLY